VALSKGTRLGPYEILSPLGAGGMGEVWRARDTRLRRDVAVKVLPDAISSDSHALARLESEARAVAALSHPNILEVHDVGTDGGVSFVVMELLEGETLHDLLARGPLPVRTVLDLALQTAGGLAAAHEKGIVHRDLKPENLFVTNEGRIKILDFGLAKATGHETPDDVTSAPTASKYTEPGFVVGTVSYMSPEQVKGLSVDHRSDVFSFGTVLYEMLSGRRAFKRPSAAETMAAILRDEPPELSESGRSIAPALVHIVNHCLEKNVDRRFQSARDVLFALSEATGTDGRGLSQPGSPVSSPRDLRAPLAAALAALLALAAVVYFLRDRPTPPRPVPAGPSVAVLPFTNLSGDKEQEYFSDGLSEELAELLTKVKELRVAGHTSSFAFKGKIAKLGDIGRELRVATVLEGSVRRSGERLRVSTRLVNVANGYQIWAETYDRKLTDVFSVQDEIAAAVVAALRIRLLPQERPLAVQPRTSNPEAYNEYLLGRHFFDLGNPEHYRRARQAYEKAIELDPEFAAAYAGLAMSEAFAADVSADTTAGLAQGRRRALAAATRALSLDPRLAEGYMARGYLRLTTTWDWTGAQEDLERALSLDPGDASPHVQYSDLLACLGRLEDAIREARTAIDLDPLSAGAWQTLGSYLKAARQFPEARRTLNRVIEIVPESDQAHFALGTLSLLEGDPETALREFTRREVRAGGRLMGAAMAEHDLGHLTVSQQSLDKLIAQYAANWAMQIAGVYAWRGQPDEAFRWLDRAYAQRDAGFSTLKIDPFIARLHDDPRYVQLLRKVGLPAS
jgi:serine/threonine protein kinase/thioredoxin-like negative regulator of GroEL